MRCPIYKPIVVNPTNSFIFGQKRQNASGMQLTSTIRTVWQFGLGHISFLIQSL